MKYFMCSTFVVFYYILYLSQSVLCSPCDCDDQCTNLDEQDPTRPCDVDCVTDLNCVASYFVDSDANCSAVPENYTESDTLSVDTFFLSYPSFKLTAVQVGITIAGLSSAVIEDFIVDTKTNLLVLTVAYSNVTIDATSTFVNYEREQEPLAATDRTRSTFERLELMTVFYSVTNPDLRRSLTIADAANGVAFEAGPCFSDSNHTTIRAKYEKFQALREISGAEGLQTRSPTIQKYFMQQKICDYGINLTAGYGQDITGCV